VLRRVTALQFGQVLLGIAEKRVRVALRGGIE